MDSSFYAFFRESLREFERGDRWGTPNQRNLPLYPAHYAAAGALESARREAVLHGRELRPDGELMIYLLAREFVAKPAIAVRGIPEPDIDGVLVSDTKTLISEARGETEISGHALIDALSGQWDSLRSASLELWGP